MFVRVNFRNYNLSIGKHVCILFGHQIHTVIVIYYTCDMCHLCP
jgi:hypothetical protein